MPKFQISANVQELIAKNLIWYHPLHTCLTTKSIQETRLWIKYKNLYWSLKKKRMHIMARQYKQIFKIPIGQLLPIVPHLSHNHNCSQYNYNLVLYSENVVFTSFLSLQVLFFFFFFSSTRTFLQFFFSFRSLQECCSLLFFFFSLSFSAFLLFSLIFFLHSCHKV